MGSPDCGAARTDWRNDSVKGRVSIVSDGGRKRSFMMTVEEERKKTVLKRKKKLDFVGRFVKLRT